MDSENHAFPQFLTGLFLSKLNSRVAHILKSFERSNQFTITTRNVSITLHFTMLYRLKIKALDNTLQKNSESLSLSAAVVMGIW